MSFIPLISVTNEDVDNESELDEKPTPNINECHTDISDIESDDEKKSKKLNTIPRCGRLYQSTPIPTDVEDYNYSSDDNDDGKDDIIDSKISLDEFLDQGYTEESIKSPGQSKKRAGPRKKFQRFTNLFPQTPENVILTDCENLDISDDQQSDNSHNDLSGNFKIILDDVNSVDIHDSVKKKPEKYFKRNDSSSDSEVEHKPRVSYRKQFAKKQDAAVIENFNFSDDDEDDDSIKIKIDLSMDAEEIAFEESDADESEIQAIVCPDIDISFVKDEPKKKTKASTSKLLCAPSDKDEGHTDVENLNSSSDSDDESRSNLLIPNAVIKSGNMILTDTEDFDGPDDDYLGASCVQDLKLPSPTREIKIFKENNNGKPSMTIMPLADNIYLGFTGDYIDKGLTDIEDLSDDESELLDDISKYNIDIIPDMECGIIQNNESIINNPKTITIKMNNDDPKTDTEEIPYFKDARKKSKKLKTRSGKPKRLLDININNNKQQVTTDVEELDISDIERGRNTRVVINKTFDIDTMTVPDNDQGMKTDTENISGDDDIKDNEIPEFKNHVFTQDNYFLITTRNSLGQNSSIQKNENQFNLPMIRKISPTPDIYLATTDTEDIQLASDTDEPNNTYSRAETATPFELQQALNESGNSTIHDTNTGIFDRKSEENFIKEHKNITDEHTDIEFLDDEVINAHDAGDGDQQSGEPSILKFDDKDDIHDYDYTKGDLPDDKKETVTKEHKQPSGKDE